ncbi:MAG: asparagine synthase-related protein [Gaiellaceae bacterium]
MTWISIFDARRRKNLYTPEFSYRVDLLGLGSLIRDPFDRSNAADRVNELFDVNIQTYLPGDLLAKMDIATIAHSLEARSALLDHELMEFAARLPDAWKISDRTRKELLKDAFRPWLPDHLLGRSKVGFGVSISEW